MNNYLKIQEILKSVKISKMIKTAKISKMIKIVKASLMIKTVNNIKVHDLKYMNIFYWVASKKHH